MEEYFSNIGVEISFRFIVIFIYTYERDLHPVREGIPPLTSLMTFSA